MKAAWITAALCLNLVQATAQNDPVNSLPAGRYEVKMKSAGSWEKGELILLDEAHYQLSGSGEKGEYRFSAAAQKVFFTSGPLRSAVAKTQLQDNKPTVIIPAAENRSLGLAFAPDDLLVVLKN